MTEAAGIVETTEDGLAAEAPPAPFADHYIVCGGNALAHRLILELVEHYEVPVLAIVPDRTRDHGRGSSNYPVSQPSWRPVR